MSSLRGPEAESRNDTSSTTAGDTLFECESELTSLTGPKVAAVEGTTREVSRMQIVGGLVGNTLEWYDFAVFCYLVEPLAENFTRGSHFVQMICVYSMFAGALFARPFGGMFFGKLGDRIGRKSAVTLAMGMMFSCSFLTGCLPTYGNINVAAPLLLFAVRICQEFCGGGQIVGSFLIFLESASEETRGFYASLVQIAGGVGTLLGAASVEICKASMTEHSLDEWGWRLPFLICGVIGTVSLIPQIFMEDSIEFDDAQQNDALLEVPIIAAMRLFAKEIVVIALVLGPGIASFYLHFIWLPTYIWAHGDSRALAASVGFSSFAFVFIALGGNLSDTKGWTAVLWKCASLNALLAPATFYLTGHFRNHWWALACVQLTNGTVMAVYLGATELFMNDMIDSVSVRYTVMGIAYNIGVCVFGGTSPLLAEAMAQCSVALVGVYQSLLSLSAVYVLLYVIPPLFEKRQSDKSRVFATRKLLSESQLDETSV